MARYEVTGPDGRRFEVTAPEGASEEDLFGYVQQTYYTQTPQPAAKEEPSGLLRQAADVPLGVAKGVTSGVRMLSDIFGADNPVSQALKGGEGYLNSLMSAQARNDQQAIAKILKDAEDKGVLDQVLAGVRAFATAPVDMLAQAAGTAIPVIAGGLAGSVLKIAPRVVGAGIGAGMGTGTVKGTIYEETKQALIDAGVSADQAEARAQLAQAYGGQNLDQILLGTALGGLTAVTGVEPAAVGAVARRILGKQAAEGVGEEAAKKLAKEAGQSRLRRALVTGTEEAIPEFLQASQEQIAANLAQQREGLEADTFRGAISAGTMEALAGAGLGAGVGAVTRPQAPQAAPPEPAPATPAAAEPEPTTEPPKLLGYTPGAGPERMYVFADGSVAVGEEAAFARRYEPQKLSPQELSAIAPDLEGVEFKPLEQPPLPLTPEEEAEIQAKPERIREEQRRIKELEKQYAKLTRTPETGEDLRKFLYRQLDDRSVLQLGKDKEFDYYRAPKKRPGKGLEYYIENSLLDAWLPETMRIDHQADSPETMLEKEKLGFDYIVDRLRGEDFFTEEAKNEARFIDEELRAIRENIEKEAGFENLRDILADIYEEELARGIEQGEPKYAAPAAAADVRAAREEPFALTQETEQERAVREAEAERTREARELKAIADREREAFTLAPEPVEREMPPTGDMFGARGLTEQPARTAAAPKAEAAQPPVLDTTGQKPIKGRHPQVVAAGRRFQEGKMSRAEFERYVDYYYPIAEIEADKLYPPSSTERMQNALKPNDKPFLNKPIADGTRVGLRMDIPALEKGVPLVSIHTGKGNENPKTGKPYASAGERIGYSSTGYIRDVFFAPRSQEKSLTMGLYPQKEPLQTAEGVWVNKSPEAIEREVKSLLGDPNWKQLGFDPKRHGYFYDRKTKQPVVRASEMYQIGNFLLAKDVEYAPKEKFLYVEAKPGEKGSTREAVEKFVNKVKEKWVNAPATQIVQSLNELPADLQEQIAADGANPKGVYDPNTQVVYMVADNISDGKDAFVVLAHEALGHFGLRSILGDRYQSTMEGMYDSNAEVRQAAKKHMDRGLSKAEAVEEVLAEAVEMRVKPTSALGRFIQAIKNIIRQIARFFGIGTLTDSQVQTLLDGARDYVIEGRSQAATAPAGGRPMYMFGKKQAAPQRTEAGQDAMNVVSSLGRQAQITPTMMEQVNSIFKDIQQNPSLAKETAKQSVINFLDKIETKVFSTDAALNNAIRRMIQDTTMSDEEKIGKLLSISSNQAMHADALASLFIQYGDIQYNPELYKYEAVNNKDNFINLSKVLDKIAAKYGLTKEEAERIGHTYFEARRLEGLSAANKTAKKKVFIHMTPEQIAAGMDLVAKIPELEQVAEIWNGIRQNAANKLIDSGLWSAEETDILLSNIDYVPFYREDQLEQGKGPKEFLRGLEVQAKEKKLKGSDMPVADIFDNMVRWTQYAVKRSVMNKLAQAKINAAVELGLATPVEEKNKGPNSVRVWENGEAKFYDMQDPLFMEAFASLESVSLPIWKFFAKMSNFLRQSVVLYPLFSVSQVPQDAFAAMFSSGLKTRYALTIPARAVKEFINTLRKSSKTHEDLRRFGAVGIKDFTSAVAREDAEVSAGLKPTPGIFNKVKNVLEHISMASDNAVRQAVYSASLDQGLSSAEAIEKAFAIINFRNKGGSPTIRMLGQVVPFFNAYLAAQHVAIKTISGVGISPSARSEALKTLAATTGAIMALSMMYAMLMDDDEDYVNKPSVMRDRLFIIPGTGMSIPIRTDIFSMPKILTEHMYMLMTDQGMADGRKFRDSMKSALGNMIFGPTPVPQAIKPLVEVAVNYNFFQGRPLIGTFQKGLDIERQFNDSTSELAKLFGQTGLVSPIAADHLFRGMLGSLGGLILFTTNPILHSATDVPRPELSLREMAAALPGTSGFISRPFETGLKNDFYVLRDEVSKAVNTFNDIQKRSPADVEDFLAKEDNVTRIGLQRAVNRITKDLTKIRQQISFITNLPESEMSATEKRTIINELKQVEQDMLRSIDIKELRRMANL